MREKDLKEGLGDLAAKAEQDHEVQMARAELYKLAKYAIKLHEMLKGISEAEGLEGWVQSKITKAAADIGSVYHHLDYQESSMAESVDTCGHCGCEVGNPKPGCDCKEDCHSPVNEAKDTHCSDKCCGSDVKAEDCTCPPTCKHCNCNAVSEGKFKSDAQRKAIHASKASGKKKMKKLRDNSDLNARLSAKLESKKKIEATKITPKTISASKIKSKKIEPQSE